MYLVVLGCAGEGWQIKLNVDVGFCKLSNSELTSSRELQVESIPMVFYCTERHRQTLNMQLNRRILHDKSSTVC